MMVPGGWEAKEKHCLSSEWLSALTVHKHHTGRERLQHPQFRIQTLRAPWHWDASQTLDSNGWPGWRSAARLLLVHQIAFLQKAFLDSPAGVRSAFICSFILQTTVRLVRTGKAFALPVLSYLWTTRLDNVRVR